MRPQTRVRELSPKGREVVSALSLKVFQRRLDTHLGGLADRAEGLDLLSLLESETEDDYAQFPGLCLPARAWVKLFPSSGHQPPLLS